MCAANSPTNSSTTSNAKSTKPEPKWLQMKRKNLSSAGKTTGPTAKKSSGSAQSPNQQTRNEKRARWAKKNKPVAKKPAAAPRGPVKEYLCECHGEPAKKPRAGTKVAAQDPESKKVKDKFLGLGKWRCATTAKRTKVTPQAAKAIPGSTAQPTIGGSFPDVVYPAKLQTPVLTEDRKLVGSPEPGDNPYLTPEQRKSVEGLLNAPSEV